MHRSLSPDGASLSPPLLDVRTSITYQPLLTCWGSSSKRFLRRIKAYDMFTFCLAHQLISPPPSPSSASTSCSYLSGIFLFPFPLSRFLSSCFRGRPGDGVPCDNQPCFLWQSTYEPPSSTPTAWHTRQHTHPGSILKTRLLRNEYVSKTEQPVFGQLSTRPFERCSLFSGIAFFLL